MLKVYTDKVVRAIAFAQIVLVVVAVAFTSLVVVQYLKKKEPTITLISKDWECIAWRPVSLESVETECTVYWRIN